MKARIVRVVGDPVQRITLTALDEFQFQAGQYITLHTPAERGPGVRSAEKGSAEKGSSKKRVPMSIASAPQRLPEFELHYRSQPDNDDARAIDDLLSKALVPNALLSNSLQSNSLQSNERDLEFSGPEGEVVVSADESTPITIFCGGTGAAQAFSIVETLSHAPAPANCRWIWCAATAQDLYATDNLELAKGQTWLNVHTFVDATLGPNNSAMRWLAEHAQTLAGDRILLCGAPSFVHQALDLLVAAGIPAEATESDVYAYAPLA